MELTYWKTKIWVLVKSRDDANSMRAQAALRAYMEDIEATLSKGIALKDFTLHDQDHSFRVAERMADIVPGDVLDRLSSFELAFLLFSAYLHDIGMTPEYSKIEQLSQFLAGKSHGLSAEEVESFQRWMDEEERTFSGDNAGEVITYYCRHKHNDWSGEWAPQHIQESPAGLVLYGNWVADLVKVCHSHHQDYDELIKPAFNPITRNGSVVHLRYLAAVLRIADILEFDPERTPEILFRQRQVDEKSRIYWLKDHEVELIVDSQHVSMPARPSSALLHRAIEQMINDIDCELQVCRNLDAQAPFKHNPANPRHELPHRWDMEPLVHRTFQPRDQDGRPAYEYIDGAFRPDTGKLLELLGGSELYGTEWAAVRELLQNAFDAVNERIARERLALPEPLDKARVDSIRDNHSVSIRVEERDDRVYLVCTDNGIGMSKAVIRDYLLVSDRRRRPEIAALERRCREKGFSLERSGKFGIGVLGYFMLADHLVLRTWCNEGEGAEACGWSFETDGIGCLES
jgi:Histidine kinase-, DNA gyrase B-, and HSP90-like ATPase